MTRPRAAGQLLLGLLVFAVYSTVEALDWGGRDTAAVRHGKAVRHLEAVLHLDPERALNAALAPHHVLRVLANYEYATTYVLSAFGLLLWLWLRRPEVYRWARNSFVLLNVAAVSVFALYPLQPPRLTTGAGYVDTVREGHTVGSWGSPLVAHANQLAAMPSLHVGWALWVSVVLAVVHGGWRAQSLSALHVGLTSWVVMATANHYLVDVLAAAVLVGACVALTGRTPAGEVVPSADAFFLHVESPDAPQQVGGVVLLDGSALGQFGLVEAQELLRGVLPDLPRFRQVLVPPTRWRRARWQDAERVDLDAHVTCVSAGGGGEPAFHRVVADVASTLLPRDRPLWRFVVVQDVEPGVFGIVFVVHHVIADGIGTVTQALHLLRPVVELGAGAARPGLVRQAVGTAVGIAQLATDGTPRAVLPTSRSAARGFTTVAVPLDEVRARAHDHGCRVSDVLLAAVAEAVHAALLRAGAEPPQLARFSVPLLLRHPDHAAEGNVTGAVLVDLPVGDAPDRLHEVARRSAPLRTPSRALAAGAVMRVAGTVLPPALHGAFARSVYGPSRFAAIVSNMPGPVAQLSMLDRPLLHAFPLLPLAPGSPVAVGALGWTGSLCLGIALDPALAPDAEQFGRDVRAALTGVRVST